MNLQQIQISDEYYDLVPRPTKEERQALKFSIMTQGQREPIVTNESGTILDGHTRFEICQELKLKPIFRLMKFETKISEQTYVIECNVNRRQLNAFQKVELSRKLFTLIQKERKENLRSSWHHCDVKFQKGSSYALFGKAIGLSEKTTQAAIKVLNSGNHTIIEQCRKGTLSINGGLSLLTQDEKHTRPKNTPTLLTLVKFFKDDPMISSQLNEIIRKYKVAHKCHG